MSAHHLPDAVRWNERDEAWEYLEGTVWMLCEKDLAEYGHEDGLRFIGTAPHVTVQEYDAEECEGFGDSERVESYKEWAGINAAHQSRYLR